MAESTKERVEDTVEEGSEKLGVNGDGGLGKKLLIPAAAGLGTLAATYAARKGPELLGNLKPKVEQKVEEKGEEEVKKAGGKAAESLKSQGGIAGKVAGKALEKATGGGGGGGKKTRRLPIQRWTDVAVPIDVAYEKWTQFDEFPKFMHRVLSVEKKDRTHVEWREKIWFWTREWEGEITERRKNERIAWKTKKGSQHYGVVTFHKLDTNLTRVMVDMNFEPTGMFEKMASGMRFVKRAVQADLARFKAYAELSEARGLDYGNDAEVVDNEDKKDKKDSGDDDREEQKAEAGGGGAPPPPHHLSRSPTSAPSRNP